MSIRLKIDPDIKVFSLLVQVFDSCGRINWLHLESLFEIFWRGIVCIESLNEPDCRIARSVHKYSLPLVEFISSLFKLFTHFFVESGQNSSLPVSINQSQMFVLLDTKLEWILQLNDPVSVSVKWDKAIMLSWGILAGERLLNFDMISPTLFIQ